MIYFIFIWSILLPVCWLIGTATLVRLDAINLYRQGDRLLLALWIGILLLALTLLTTSLVFPLTPLVGAIVVITLSAAALNDQRTRSEAVDLGQTIPIPTIVMGLVAGIAIASLTSQEVTWIDAGLYHYSLIQWLAKFGTIPGLALLFSNLGFTSSWFALVAPFSGEALNFRATAVINGLIFLITLFHLLLSLQRVRSKTDQIADWFIICSLLFLIPFVATNNLLSLILVSASPDLPIIFLPLIIAWSIMPISAVEKQRNSQKGLSSPIEKVRLIPLILAIGAVTIKLTALPLLLICWIFQAKSRKPISQMLLSTALIFVLLMPFLAANTLTSGCPLYPSSALCLNLPWSVSGQAVAAIAESTHGWTPWSPISSGSQDTGSFLLQWLTENLLDLAMTLMTIILVGCIVYSLAKTRLRYSPGYLWTILLSACGVGFFWLTSPFFRFALGFLTLPPAFLVASFLQQSYSQKQLNLPFHLVHWNRLWGNRQPVSPQLLAISTFIIVLALTYSIQHAQILLPPPVKTVQFTQNQLNGILYRSPIHDLCWTTEIPCVSELRKVKLREPQHGLSKGFIRAD